MIKFTKQTGIAAIALFASAISAQAAIVPAVGLDLSRNKTQDAGIQVFSEQTNVTVGANAVTLDYLVGGNINVSDNETGVSSFSSGPFLTAGTYDSFLVHFDPSAAASAANITVDFGSTIVGIIVSNSGTAQLLKASDALFGTAAKYDNHIGRRTETSDTFSLTNASTLTLNLSTSATHVDNIRVLTQTQIATVPVPASLPLLLAGVGGLAALRRRSKQA